MNGVFHFPSAQGALPIAVRVADGAATTIVDATDNSVIVGWFEINEVLNGTQTLTVDIYDGTNATILGDDNGASWTAKAVVAKTSYKFSKGYVIPKGSLLRVTSGSGSGGFHVSGVRQRAV